MILLILFTPQSLEHVKPVLQYELEGGHQLSPWKYSGGVWASGLEPQWKRFEVSEKWSIMVPVLCSSLCQVCWLLQNTWRFLWSTYSPSKKSSIERDAGVYYASSGLNQDESY